MVPGVSGDQEAASGRNVVPRTETLGVKRETDWAGLHSLRSGKDTDCAGCADDRLELDTTWEGTGVELGLGSTLSTD